MLLARPQVTVPSMHIDALATDAAAKAGVRAKVSLRPLQRMPAFTVGLSRLTSHDTLSPPLVLFAGDGLQVGWIHAAAVPAKVVEFFFLGDGPD